MEIETQKFTAEDWEVERKDSTILGVEALLSACIKGDEELKEKHKETLTKILGNEKAEELVKLIEKAASLLA